LKEVVTVSQSKGRGELLVTDSRRQQEHGIKQYYDQQRIEQGTAKGAVTNLPLIPVVYQGQI